MNNKITGGSLYPDIQFGQLRFLDVLYRVIQTKLLQEPLFAHCGAGGGPLPRARKKSSKLELKGEVGRSRVARVVRTLGGSDLPCCHVQRTREGSGTKSCENKSLHKFQSKI